MLDTITDLWLNSLWPSGHIATLVNIGSGNGLLPFGTKPLPEPTLTNDQRWLMISGMPWHSPDSNFIENTQDIYRWNEFETIVKPTGVNELIPTRSLKLGQWRTITAHRNDAMVYSCSHLMNFTVVRKTRCDWNRKDHNNYRNQKQNVFYD